MGPASKISFAVVKWGVLVPLTLFAYLATGVLFLVAALASGNSYPRLPHWGNFVAAGLPGLIIIGLWALFHSAHRAVQRNAERDEPF